MENGESVRISRKEAVGIDKLIALYIDGMKLREGLNARRIYAAWNEVSGASGHTLRRYFRGGVLYVTVSSSMVRSQLYFQRDILVERMNGRLALDPMFKGEACPVKKLVLK